MTDWKPQCPNAEKIIEYNRKHQKWDVSELSSTMMKKLKIEKHCTNKIGMTRIYKKQTLPLKSNPNKKTQQLVPIGWLCEGCGHIIMESKDGKKI